jgi:hypothetical protein
MITLNRKIKALTTLTDNERSTVIERGQLGEVVINYNPGQKFAEVVVKGGYSIEGTGYRMDITDFKNAFQIIN